MDQTIRSTKRLTLAWMMALTVSARSPVDSSDMNRPVI